MDAAGPVILVILTIAVATVAAFGIARGIALLESRGFRPSLVVAGLIALLALAVFTQLDALLATMHLPGHARDGIDGLKSLSQTAVDDVVGAWADYRGALPAAMQDRYASPTTVIVWGLALDAFLYVPAYVSIVGLLLRRGRRESQHRSLIGKDSRAGRYIDLAVTTVPAVAALAWIQNALSAVLVARFWDADAGALARLQDIVRDWRPGILVVALWTAWTLKTLLLAAILGAGAILAARFLKLRRVHEIGRAIVVLRLYVLLLFVFLALLLVAQQTPDAIRRWTSDLSPMVAAVLLTMLLGSLICVLAYRTLGAHEQLVASKRDLPLGRVVIATGVVAAALAVTIQAEGLLSLAAVLVLVWLGGKPFERTRSRDPLHARGNAVPALLGAAPVVLLGIAIIRASAGVTAFYVRDNADSTLLLILGCAVLFAAWPFFHVLWRGTRSESPGRRVRYVIALAGAVGAYLTWRVIANVWATADALGTIGSIAAFLMVAALVLGSLFWLTTLYRPPALFAALGFRRFPTFTLLILWAFVATRPGVGDFHDVRYLDDSTSRFQSITLGEAFDSWLQVQDAAKQTEGGKQALPLLLVASSGGGIRSSYWTSLLMNCIFERVPPAPGATACEGDPPRRLVNSTFAFSGISGGSLGFASYAAHMAHGEATSERWVEDRLGGDYLGGGIAWMLFVEFPRVFFGFDPGMDRAEVLERSWERAWQERPTGFWNRLSPNAPGASSDSGPMTLGLSDIWHEHVSDPDSYIPLLMFSGTSVADGCRFNTSVLEANVSPEGSQPEACLSFNTFEGPRDPSKYDSAFLATTNELADYICPDRDVRLSTATLLSARATYVSPSGRIVYRDGCPQGGSTWTNVVDGGYFDASGASPLVEMYPRLESFISSYNSSSETSCVVPFFVQIDNGYESPAFGEPHPVVHELTVPRETGSRTSYVFDTNARTGAALIFDRPFGGGGLEVTLEGRRLVSRYQHLSTHGHPGVEAPLGWTLSQESKNDLRSEVDEAAEAPGETPSPTWQNHYALEQIARWLTGDLRCQTR